MGEWGGEGGERARGGAACMPRIPLHNAPGREAAARADNISELERRGEPGTELEREASVAGQRGDGAACWRGELGMELVPLSAQLSRLPALAVLPA